MASEDIDGTVSSNPFVYDQIKSLGVSASVWDDVLDELFDEPCGNITGPFGFLLDDFNGKIWPQRLDYTRPKGTSDHEYVWSLLKQSIEELSDHPELPDDDGSDCAEAIDEYWKHRSSRN